MIHSRLVLLVIAAGMSLRLVQPASAQVPPAQRFADVPAAVFEEARLMAVRNGLASLLARQQAPENDTGLIFPPTQWRRVVDWAVTEVPHRAVQRKEPVYEKQYAERLAPQRDEYGQITGYKKEKVVVSQRIVGYKEVTRYVRDPEGDVMRTVRRPVYDDQTKNQALPRGFFGLNGMALYVLCRAGLGDDGRVREHALSLRGLLNEYGLPDTTWDVAWLTIGYAHLPDRAGYEPLIDHLASKLIGSQAPAREREGAGLWGPVAINYDAFLRYFDLEMKVRAELDRVRAAAEALPEDAKAQRQRASQIIAKLEAAQGDLNEAMRVTSQQGTRLRSMTTPWKVSEDTTIAPLPHYAFSRIALDMRSTAAALAALAVLERQELLPPQTVHPAPTGKPVVSPVNTRAVIAAALAGVAKHQQPRTDGWNQTNRVIPNATFAKVPPGLFEPVPDGKDLPTLLTYDTVPSNLAGYAALAAATHAAPPLAGRYADALARAEPRALAVLDRLIDAQPQDFAAGSPHRQRVTTLDQIKDNKGQIPVDDADPAAEVKDLYLTRDNMPAVGLESAVALFWPSADAPQQVRNAPHFRRLAYRLMVSQESDGQWENRRTREVGESPVEHALGMQDQADRIYQGMLAGGKKFKELRHDAEMRRYHHQRMHVTSPTLHPTLAALVVLIEGVHEPVEIPDALVVPTDEQLALAETIYEDDTAGGVEGEDADEADAQREPLILDAEFMAGALDRPNTALAKLMAAVGQAPAQPTPAATEPQVPAEQPPAQDAPAEQPQAQAKSKAEDAELEETREPAGPAIEDNLDDILGP